ncbi:cupredoxin domain-containing protein [Paenibacillus glycanilyticus]|uniref:cupredoxin domain-containing protein n=1 Tax=Paenibacillus glycanilyticus TaxID=126569 RepID=UPI00203F84E4|nr:cupredoxin domain-containing protein [Paenibacillus glycanilyticus]MCM3630831.1 cupredoxin domain-containing protein [Paenibacillus glycanilyticus]
MGLDIGSLLLVLGATVYLMIAGTANRTIAIALIFLASAALGFLLIETLDYRLGLSAVIAGAAVTALGMGYMKKYGVATAVNAAITGWLGAGIGLFAGARFYVSDAVMISADITFVALAFLMQKAAERYDRNASEPAGTKRKSAVKTKRAFSGVPASAAYAVAVALFFSVLLSHANHSNAAKIGQTSTADAVYDADNGFQTATVEVNGAGFNPRNINFRSDVMIKLVFHVTSLSADGMTFVSEDLNLEAPLHKGDNIFMLKKALPGVYGFTVQGSSVKGTFTVQAIS